MPYLETEYILKLNFFPSVAIPWNVVLPSLPKLTGLISDVLKGFPNILKKTVPLIKSKDFKKVSIIFAGFQVYFYKK